MKKRWSSPTTLILNFPMIVSFLFFLSLAKLPYASVHPDGDLLEERVNVTHLNTHETTFPTCAKEHK